MVVSQMCEAGRWSGFEEFLYRAAYCSGAKIHMDKVIKGWISHTYFFRVEGTEAQIPIFFYFYESWIGKR